MTDNGQILRDDCVSLEGYTRQNPIRSICPYNDETMLIGIDGQGVYQMNRNGSGQASLLFDANESVHGVLHGNGVYSVLVDQWKNIVVGTYSYYSSFQPYSQQPTDIAKRPCQYGDAFVREPAADGD